MPLRERCGLRLGLSRQLEVVRTLPTAVAFDASALEDEAHGLHGRFAECAGIDELSGYQIVQVGRELESPAIEAKIQDYRLLALQNRDRTKIPCPGVIGFDLINLTRSRAKPASAMALPASSISGATISSRSKRVISRRYRLLRVAPHGDWTHSVPAWGHAMSTAVLLFPLCGKPAYRF